MKKELETRKASKAGATIANQEQKKLEMKKDGIAGVTIANQEGQN